MLFTEQEAAEISQKGPSGQAQAKAKVLKAVGFAASGSLDEPSGDELAPWILMIGAAAWSIAMAILVTVPG